RPKLVLLQLAAVAGFIIALSVIFFYSGSIIKLKDFQIHSEKVLSAAEQIKSRIDSIMTSNVDLFDQKAAIIDSIYSFGIIFNQFRDPEMIKGLPDADRKVLSDLIDRWFEIYETHYLSLFIQMDTIIASPYMEENKGRELLSILYELFDFGYELEAGDDDLQMLFEIQRIIRITTHDTNTFLTDLQNELIELQEYTDNTTTRSMIMAIIVSLLTFVFSLLIITTFSRRMGTRIIQMRDAIRSLSMGDFSHELHIESGDEFENFSDHFNVFKNELWEKLESVLDFMLEISGSISIESNLDRVLEIVIDSAVKNTAADAGSVFLVDELDDSLIKQKIAIGLLPPLFYVPPEYITDMKKLVDLVHNTSILTGETIIGRSVENGTNIFIRDVLLEEEMEQNQEEGSFLYISSIIVVPLIIAGRVLGTIVLAKTRPGEKFTDIDFNHIRTFSDYAALTIDNIYNYHDLIEKSELHREIRIAADIQKNLLPGTIPDTKGLSFAAFTEAARGVSGDYYDFFRLDKNKSAIIICDVVGKGVPASLLMIMIRTIIRLAASPKRNAAQILTILNRAIIGRTDADQFATMSFIIYDESTKEVAYSNAAHAPLLHYQSRSRSFLEIDTPGLPIGIEGTEIYAQKVVTLDKEDILALYTDGITEA
ncbi:MAG: SpoIIE family protein phosphatase, partial [Spirochaetales bacterium]|nr:SpoIIE family protein phosphatase [Spirochaetales bacterium]